ncbi:MAG: DUF2062 domain-containing protein [Deltaproteobacteria bacterium]|nr:DUF2062 domain-containing protein [Deltaproteobacteria bacterium]
MAFKLNYKELVERFKTLQGDPHYIAVGMAVGVFVGITPTIPFHTLLAIAMAFVLRGSKPAAAIGVWICNPITLPFFYLASFQAGMFIFGKSIPSNIEFEVVTELMALGMDVTIAMITGGIVLGIIPGIVAYFLTRKLVVIVRSRSKISGSSSQVSD